MAYRYQFYFVILSIIGSLLIYGPVRAQEIYNQNGELLAVSWFDGHGVRKSAVDRGIVEEKDQLEGTFVLVVDGDPA